jgi:hypothetical protein
VLAKFGAKPSVSKGATQKFDTERFNLKNLNEVQVRGKYQLKI